MSKEVLIAIIAALVPIQAGILGWAMNQRRRKRLGTSSAVCIVLAVLFLLMLSMLVAYLRGKVSQGLLLYMAIGLTGAMAIIGVVDYLLRQRESKEEPQGTQVKSLYDHNAYVAKMITDSKKDALLALPDALRALAELDGELALEIVNTKRPKGQLVGRMQRVLDRLQEESGIERLDKGLPDQAIVNSVNDAITELNVSGTKVNPETLTFMHHVAGVLDEERIGISARRERSDEYKKVARLQASIATQILTYAVSVYMTYSLGITSVLMMVESCPPELMARVMKLFGQTRTELRRERRDTLDFLLAGVNGLKEEELHGQYINNEPTIP